MIGYIPAGGGLVDVTLGGSAQVRSTISTLTIYGDDTPATGGSVTVESGGSVAHVVVINALNNSSFQAKGVTGDFDFSGCALTTASLSFENCTTLPACPAGCSSYTASDITGSDRIAIADTAPATLDFSGIAGGSLITYWCFGTLPTAIVPGNINYNFQGQSLPENQINTVDGVLAFLGSGSRLSAITGGTINISGGTNAAPEMDVPATHATVDVTHPDESGLASSGPGSWYRLAGGEYFWANVDSGNTDPAPGGTGYPVFITSGDTAVDVATKYVNVAQVHGYTGIGGATISYTRVATGQGTACEQIAGNPFTFSNEDDGDDASNHYIDALMAKTVTVTTN